MVADSALAGPAVLSVATVAPAKARPEIATPIRREIPMEDTSFGRRLTRDNTAVTLII
jgi:hypothetical protein